METNALWALAALATFFILFFSLEIYVPLWQFIRLSIFGNLGRFLLFLVMGVLATCGAYWALRGYSPIETAPQSAVPQTKAVAQKAPKLPHKRTVRVPPAKPSQDPKN